MVSMPYMFQKGEAWQTLEQHLSYDDDGARIARKKAMLEFLRNPPPATRRADFKNRSGPNSPEEGTQPQLNTRMDHLQWDWFGLDNAGAPFNHPASGGVPSDGVGPPPTSPHCGWWLNWHGDVAAIFREALQRAIEVSLGLTHGAPVPDAPDRDWPIEFVWICPVGWFQAGISWRKLKVKQPGLAAIATSVSNLFSNEPDRQGLVTVTWLTPGNTPSAVPGAPPTGFLYRNLGKDTGADGQARRGHWIVGHQVTSTVAPPGVSAGPKAAWGVFVPGNNSRDPKTKVISDVVTVEPAAKDGGVDDTWDY